MKIGKFYEYKGYTGSIEFSSDDQCYFGRLLNINDLVHYEADTVEDLNEEFKEAVDDYIEFIKVATNGGE
jgi:predicted HicB family RNase H-like nuclease